jgi:hypothetical protein
VVRLCVSTEAWDFFCPSWHWGPHILLQIGYRGLFCGDNRLGREADHSPPSSADVRNALNYKLTSTPPYDFMACTTSCQSRNVALLAQVYGEQEWKRTSKSLNRFALSLITRTSRSSNPSSSQRKFDNEMRTQDNSPYYDLHCAQYLVKEGERIRNKIQELYVSLD